MMIEGDLVYDSFMGTGTTAVGCRIEKVNYIGSEISKRYVEFSEERISVYENQLQLF